ncbi:Protein kinase-like domain [Pseudocohnilembus persalinus]|uniref:Aurora kinase n=1 Tax=Pseudocohnilembus persalinus TaxID=266149 RepID=A0A0V0QFH0_PSEPJ|nr:Protein kinase-like domain [Pseudocohnilembus persalinus]|eukprot:KRX00888.1 Protein kinase-like domain [Pseudocohnilembus persalinus]
MNQNYIKGFTSTNQPGQTINYTVQNSSSNNYRLGGYNQQVLSQKNTVQLQNQIQNNVNTLNYQQNIPLTSQNQNLNNNNNYNNNNNSNNQGSSYKSSNNSNQIPGQVSSYSNQTKTYFQTVGQSPIIKTQGQINVQASNNVGFNNNQQQTQNIINIKSEDKITQQGLDNKNQDKYQLQPITSSRSQISYINEQPKNDDNKKEQNTQPQVYQKEEFMKSKSRISLTKNSGSYRSSGNGNEAGTNTQYENNQIQNFGSYQANNSQNNNQSPYSLSGSYNKGDNINNVNNNSSNNINNNYGGNSNNNYVQQQQISQPQNQTAQNSNNIKNSNTSINNNINNNSNNNSKSNQQSYSAYQKEEYRKRKAQNAQAGNQSTSNRVSGLGFSKFNEENAQYQNSQPSSGIAYLEKKHSSMSKAYSQQVFVSNQEQQQQLNNLYDQNQNNQKRENNSVASNNYYGTVGFNYQEQKQKNLQNDQNQTYKQRYTYSNNKNENNYQNHQNESQKVEENKEVKKLDLFGENDKIKNLDSFSKQVSSPKPGLINNFNLNNKIKDEKKEQSYQALTQTYKEQAPDLVQKQNQLPGLQQKISANSTGNQGVKQVYQQFSNNQMNPTVYGQNLQEKYQIQQQNQLNQQGKETGENKISNDANINSNSKNKYKESKRRSLTPQYNQQYQRKQNIQNTQNLHKQITTTTHYLGNKKITVKTEEDSQNNKRIVTKITEEMASDGKTVLSKQKVTSVVDMSSDYMSSKKLAEIEKTMNKEEKEQYFNDLQLLAQQNLSYTNKNQNQQQQQQQQNQNLSLNQQQQNLSQNQNLIQQQQLSSKQNSNQEQGQKILGQNLDKFQVKSEFMKSYDPVLEGKLEEISSQNNSLGKNYNQNLNQNQNQNQQNISNYTKTTPLSVAEFNEAQKIKKQDLVIKTNSGNSNNNNQLQVQDLKSSDNVLVPSGKPSFTNQNLNQNQDQLQLQSKSSANQQENQDKESQRISQNAQNQEQKNSNQQGQNGSTHQNLSKTQYKIQENDQQEKAVSYYNVPKRKEQKNQRISYSLAEGSSKEYRTLSNLVNQSQNSQNQISNHNLMSKQNNNDYDDSISNIESAKSKNYIDLQSNIKNIDVQSVNSSKYNRDYTPQYGRHGVISYKHQNGVSSFSNNVNYLQNKNNKDQKNYFFGESLSELQIQREGSETFESGKISQKQQSSQQQKEGFNSGNSLIKNIQHEKIHEKPSIMEDSKNSGNQNLHNLTASRSKSQERQYNSRFSPTKQDNARQQQPSTFQLQHQKNLENQNQSQNQNQGDNSSNNLSHIEQVKQQDRFYALNLLNKYKNTIQHTQSLRGDSPGGSSDFQFTGGQKNPFQVIKTVHKSATPRNDAENISWQQAVQKNNNNNDINYPNKDSFQKGEDKLSKQKDKNIKKMPFPQAYRWSLKNFSIFKALGKGIFGTVYLAKEKTNNYLMALKVMEKSKIHEMNLVDQTMKELKIHYYLDHPNILQCYGYFPTQTQLIMALEYCYGGNLYEKLYKQPNRRFREQEGANYIAQIISAVQYLHKNHIIHRDIKPENILLNNDTVKLSDFGIASFNDGMRQTFCGTLEYVSPEIIDRQLYDYNVDVWAIGVLAYEICNGDPPFMGKDQKRIIQNVAFNMPRHFSVELKDFVNSLLRKNPNERMDLDQAMKHPWIQKNCVLYSQKSEKANAVIGQQQSDLFI